MFLRTGWHYVAMLRGLAFLFLRRILAFLFLRRILALFFLCGPAFACDYPDLGNLPLRRAVAKVKYLPETEAWAASMREAGAVVQYALLLDQPRRANGRCYWPVEVRAGGTLWRRFYVTPDGRRLLDGTADRPRRAGR